MCTGAMNLQQLSNLKDKESVLNILMTEGYIEAARVDPILLTTLLEDLLILPGSVNEKTIFLPGPKLGLKHVPIYAVNNNNKNKKSLCLQLTDIVDKTSGSAARNLILFDVFNQIEKVQQLINVNAEKCDEAYQLICEIERNLLQIQTYFPNDYRNIENKIITLKRKIEIETNIFSMK